MKCYENEKYLTHIEKTTICIREDVKETRDTPSVRFNDLLYCPPNAPLCGRKAPPSGACQLLAQQEHLLPSVGALQPNKCTS